MADRYRVYFRPRSEKDRRLFNRSPSAFPRKQIGGRTYYGAYGGRRMSEDRAKREAADFRRGGWNAKAVEARRSRTTKRRGPFGLW